MTSFIIYINNKKGLEFLLLTLALGISTLHKDNIIGYSPFWTCMLCFYRVDLRVKLNIAPKCERFLSHFDELYDLCRMTKNNEEIVAIHKNANKNIYKMLKNILIESKEYEWGIMYDHLLLMKHDCKYRLFNYMAITNSTHSLASVLLLFSLGILVLNLHENISKSNAGYINIYDNLLNHLKQSTLLRDVYKIMCDIRNIVYPDCNKTESKSNKYKNIKKRIIPLFNFHFQKMEEEHKHTNFGEWQINFHGWS